MARIVELSKLYMVALDDGREALVARIGDNPGDYCRVKPGMTSDGRMTLDHKVLTRDSEEMKALRAAKKAT